MGYWGEYLFQSDADLDTVAELSDRAGLELYAMEAEDETAARKAFDDGKFDKLFDEIRAEKKKRTLVFLTMVAMQMGARVKSNQRNLVEQIYKKAHLMAGAEKQAEKALKEYENGNPWKFEESKGLFETMQNPRQDGFTSPFMIPMGRHGDDRGEIPKEAEKKEASKTLEERAKEKFHELAKDPNYQKYLASALEK